MTAGLRLVPVTTVAGGDGDGDGESPAIVDAGRAQSSRAGGSLAEHEDGGRDPAVYRRGLASARHALRSGVAHHHARRVEAGVDVDVEVDL